MIAAGLTGRGRDGTLPGERVDVLYAGGAHPPASWGEPTLLVVGDVVTALETLSSDDAVAAIHYPKTAL